jgi:hypothetical protein
MSKKKQWTTAPNAAQKVQEAHIAFGKMKATVAYEAPIARRGDFLLYLNGFQEACYSVTISLDKTKRGWRQNLAPQEAELVNFMVEQRGTETHNAGATGLRSETKWHPASRFKGVEITPPPRPTHDGWHRQFKCLQSWHHRVLFRNENRPQRDHSGL